MFIRARFFWRQHTTQCLAGEDLRYECGELLSRDTIQCLVQDHTQRKDLKAGRHLLCSIVSNGLDSVTDLADYLIRMFTSCVSLPEADLIFLRFAKPTLYTWQAIISAHALLGDGKRAIELFHRLQQQGFKPCKYIFLSALKAIGKLKHLPEGRIAHTQVLQSGLESDVVVASTLIDMYAKCGSLEEACKVFDISANVNVVSWNAMIAGYVQQQEETSAFDLFIKMQKSGIHPTKFTFSCMLKACSNIGQGKRIHEQVILSMLESDVVVGTALIDMYAKCGDMEQAHKAFDSLITPDLFSWNAIIAGYTHHGHGFSALKLFGKMMKDSIKVDKMTFSSVIKACGSIGAIKAGRLVYNEIAARRLETDLVIGNTLIDLYAKCGCLEEAHKVLNTLSNRDLVSWNILVSVYAQHGNCQLVQQCLWNMIREGIKPDDRTFLSILAACSHAGHVDEGHKYFMLMVEEFGVTHSTEHFNCMIDLLGRAGHLKDAEVFLESMPVLPSSFTGWTSLLTACTKYSNMELGMQSFDKSSLLNPVCGSGYVLSSNLCAGADMWQEAVKLQKLRKSAGAWKVVGRVWIEIEMNVHEFTAGNKNHVDIDYINAKLENLTAVLKKSGHVPELNLVLELGPG